MDHDRTPVSLEGSSIGGPVSCAGTTATRWSPATPSTASWPAPATTRRRRTTTCPTWWSAGARTSARPC